MSDESVLVIGGGPAGLEAARGAADLGSEVILVEQRARLGVALWHPLDAPMDVESLRLGVA